MERIGIVAGSSRCGQNGNSVRTHYESLAAFGSVPENSVCVGE